MPWLSEPSPAEAGPDVTQFEHPADAGKASPMQTLAAALTFGRSASKANEEAARRAASIPANDPLSLQNMPAAIGPDVYIHAARLYEVQNNLEQAASNYQRALGVDPNNADALVGFARLHDRQGKFEQATELYTRALQAHPQNARIHNDLAICLNRQGRTDESLQAMQRAIQLEPREALFRNNIAKMLVQAGREGEALHHLSAVFPPAHAHYNVGYLLYEHKRTDLAAQHFAKALELQPGFEQAGKMIQVVQVMASTPRPVPGQTPSQLVNQSAPSAGQPTGPTLAPPHNAGRPSRYSSLPPSPSAQAPTQQPYADPADENAGLMSPVVEMPTH